jgi:hypothetical protein
MNEIERAQLRRLISEAKHAVLARVIDQPAQTLTDWWLREAAQCASIGADGLASVCVREAANSHSTPHGSSD